MAIVLDDTQQMLRDSALAFLRENAPIRELRRLRDSRDDTGFSHGLWDRFAELGFAGVLIDEQYGGSGLGATAAGVIAEAIGTTLAPLPFMSTAVLGATLIGQHGSPAQRQTLLPAMAAGRHIVALAIDESARHRPERINARAERVGDQYRIDGAKTFVVDGHVADTLIVAARTSDGAGDLALYLVPRGTAGLRIERAMLADSTNAARVVFDDVRVPASAMLGSAGQGEGAAALERALDIGRAVLASELVGIADESFTRTVGYLKERRQFGRAIGEFQALQHRAAHLFAEIELARAAVLQCQQRLDTRTPDGPEPLVCVAKAKAGAAATLAVQEGVQMHGGIGMTDEFDMGFYMKRARTVQEWLGDANWQMDRWATLRGY